MYVRSENFENGGGKSLTVGMDKRKTIKEGGRMEGKQ